MVTWSWLLHKVTIKLAETLKNYYSLSTSGISSKLKRNTDDNATQKIIINVKSSNLRIVESKDWPEQDEDESQNDNEAALRHLVSFHYAIFLWWTDQLTLKLTVFQKSQLKAWENVISALRFWLFLQIFDLDATFWISDPLF